tara:strand:+ start:9000 stop:9758 length:759 start_codon:yes stop_codon:yes gene_type:complete
MKRINMLEAAKRLVDILQNVNFETIAVDLDHVHTQLCDENVKFMPEYIKWVLEVIESLTCRRDAAIQAFKTVDDYVSLSPDVAAAIQNQYLTQVKECITNAIITPSDIIRFCSAETNTCESFPDAYTSAIDLVVQHEADLIGLCEMWAIDVHFNVETLMKMQLVQEFITNQEQAVQDVIAFLKARNLPHSNFIEKFVPKTEELNKKREQQKLLAAEIDRVTGEALNVTSEKKQFEYAMKLSALNQEYYQLYY